MNKELFSKDTDNLYAVIRDSWQQAENAWKPIDLSGMKSGRIDNIIITGLGGSAISGDVLKNFLGSELRKPLIVNRTYTLPAYAGENTLVIASSYSGNTEETVSAFKSAIERGCPAVALTTGGEIGRLAAENGIPAVELQKGFQPRYALYNSFFTLLRVVQELKLVDSQEKAAADIISFLKSAGERLGSENSEAYRLASRLKDTIPVIYSVTDLNDSAGKRFKGQLNENSKVHAWMAEYPEMNHNEIVGWETVKGSGLKYTAVTLVDDEILPRIGKRIEIINKLLALENIDILNIQGNCATFKERLIEVIYLCDWISYYLALLNEEDPGEIDFIHHLKNKMAED